MDMDDYEDDAEDTGSDSEGSIVEALEREETEPIKRRSYEEYNVNKKRQKTLDSVQPPTVQELNQLRETENLFNSSLFRMQIEEMLKETCMKAKYQNLFTEWLEEFKSFLFGLMSTKEYDLTDNSWHKDFTVEVPVILKPASDKGKFKFVCPDDVTIGGSHSIQACLGPSYTTDLHIHMPTACFEKSDHINLRFDRKRAFYLTVLAEAMLDCRLIEETNFVHGNGCILKPLLEVKPSGKLGRHIRVLLWPVTNSSVLSSGKLHPGRGNIRSKWYQQTSDSKVNEATEPSTSQYNSGVAQDVFWQQNQEMLESELSAPSLQAGLLLLKIWLRQRHLDQGYGSFGGFIMAMYLVYLIQKKRLNKLMSSYQVARVTWSCLAQSDWTKDGISLSSAANGFVVKDFQQQFEVVFIDGSGTFNLCATLRKEIYMQVKCASAQAVELLDSSASNSFQTLFMTPVDFLHSVDDVIRLHNTSTLAETVQNYSTCEQQLVHAGWTLPQLLNVILPCLKRGLGQKISSIVVQPPKIERWALNEPPPSPQKVPGPLLLGLCLNAAYAFEKLELGPAADQPETEEFRIFWGEMSELRRFRDGSIRETVLWSGNASICEQVVQYVLKKHAGLEPDSYLYVANLVDPILELPMKYFEKLHQRDAAVPAVMAAFDSLAKQLRQLSDVSLSVNTVQGISPVFRYTDVFPPLALKQKHLLKVFRDKSIGEGQKTQINLTKLYAPRYCPPIEAVMMLELSGKWPENLQAVRRLKAAFCVQMATALQKECDILAQADIDHVDIFKHGFVFRVWLAALKEVSLMKQRIGALGLKGYHDTPETLALEEKLVMLPKITSSLHGLHQQFPGFGPSACLVKRWVSSQFLGPPYFPDLVIELLVAYLFVSPEPFHLPVRPQLGLLHFLRLVSSTDWQTVPIIVNLNSEFTRDRIAELETKFHSSRKSLPPLFLATPYDRSVSQATSTAPSLQMLIRLGSLASEALNELQNLFLRSQHPDCLPIFRPNLADYDVVIKLKVRWLTRIHESVDFENDVLRRVTAYEPSIKETFPLVGFDPVQSYLAELREGYSFCALFFHDQYGGNVIGVVWKPQVKNEKDFKVSLIGGHKPTKNSKIILNTEAILEDFEIIGSGLVQSIDNNAGKKEVS